MATSSLKLTSGETICRTIPLHLIWTQLGRENNASILHTSSTNNTEDEYDSDGVILNLDAVLECIILDWGAEKTSGIKVFIQIVRYRILVLIPSLTWSSASTREHHLSYIPIFLTCLTKFQMVNILTSFLTTPSTCKQIEASFHIDGSLEFYAMVYH